MKIPAPNRIMLSLQTEPDDPVSPIYVYICGDPHDVDTRTILYLMAPLSAGDYIYLATGDESEPKRQRVTAIEFHELDLMGLGDLRFVPCLIFD